MVVAVDLNENFFQIFFYQCDSFTTVVMQQVSVLILAGCSKYLLYSSSSLLGQPP